MFIFLLLILLLLIFILFYKYNSSDNRTLPALRPQFYYGNLLQTGIANRKNSMANALAEFQQNYGDRFQFYYFSKRLIVFNTIEHVQEIYRNRHLFDRLDLFYKNARTVLPRSLLSIQNNEWKRHARIIEPLLKRSCLTQYFDQILKCTDELIETWLNETNMNKLQTNIIDQCQQLLLKIMVSISYDEENNNQQLIDAITECNKWSSWAIFNGLNVLLINLYMKYFNPKYHQARQQIRNLINKTYKNNQSKTFLQSLIKSSLSQDELLDEILMINTGVDGVSTTLSWFIYYMIKYPYVQEKLKFELKQYSTKHLTNEMIDQFEYIDLVIKEILRHSPVADITMRTIVEKKTNNLIIDGIHLHQGDSIAIAVSNIHHDQRYWKIDPALFYPERFLEDDKDHSTYAYLPFGLGHYRSCPGKYLVLYQLKVICLRLMQKVTFVDAKNQENSNNHVKTKDGGFVGLTNLAVYIKYDQV